MARRERGFQTIRSEGGLLPDDLLRRILDPKQKLPGTSPEDYSLPPGERINEVVTQSWNRLSKHWADFRSATAALPKEEPGTGVTNDKWTMPLLRELGFGLLPAGAGPEIGGRTYAISRFFGPVPVHLVGLGVSLDRRAAGVRGAAAVNPHGLVQEFINRSPNHLWAIASNGLRLRVLRDNQALSRQAFLEFDLEAMFDGEVYSDFVVLWLMAHATRFAPRDGGRPDTCWLEQWSQLAAEQGTRALGDLRRGVEKALQILGEGFTSHPKNSALRDALRSGQVSLSDFHGQLVRVVYRLIFLFVAEDRTIDGQRLLHPRDNSDAGRVARERFAAHYGTGRLRELAGAIKGSRHGDLWRQFQVVVRALSGEPAFEAAREHLALPSLGSFLWNPSSTSALNEAELSNHDVLEAVRHLAFTRQGKVLRPVDYRNLGAEELGGVYESLLGLIPQISADGARFTFAEFAGSERKTSGSYYTPDSLVQSLLDSALDPVVDEAVNGKTSTDAEKAILALKVCDPAVGSGHFLVGAAHRLARHLARARALAQGESEPSPLLYQHALRDVIGRCLYGVDQNPMAAELCRVSLWLEAVEPGKPLSFLDHHIRVGNSLLGATPELIARGIPDEAFTPLDGDDRKACAVLKKRNNAERKGLGPLFTEQEAEIQERLRRSAATLEELPDDRPEHIRVKELAFRRHEETEEYRHKKELADAWCSAFVIKKSFCETGRESTARGITQSHLNAIAMRQSLPSHLSRDVESLSGEFGFFHWHLAFPEVFGRGGFDSLLGNPPWERVKLQEQEFFASRDSAIAHAQNAAARKKLIAALPVTRPELWEEWSAASRKAQGESHFARNSGRYPLCGQGDINTYALFAEHNWQILGPRGRAGFIVPSGIATDDTTKDYFQAITKTGALRSLWEFENEGFFSAGKGHMLRFALTTLSGRGASAAVADFMFQGQALSDLDDRERHFTLSAADIQTINPNTGTCPIFRTKRDALIALAIYRKAGILWRENEPDGNPWGLRFMAMFHMANDSALFRTRSELAAAGWELAGNRFLKDGSIMLPLYEAKMAYIYNHRSGTFEGAPLGERPHRLPAPTDEQLADPSYAPLPFYWVSQAEIDSKLAGASARGWLLGWRDVTDARASVRTVVACILPRVGVGHKMPIALPSTEPRTTVAMCANLSSFALDYAARQKVGGLSLTYFVLKQLPVLSPRAYQAVCAWERSSNNLDWILSRALELTYTAWDLQSLAEDCGDDGAPYIWDSKRRFQIQCELDAAFFHLYGISREDVDYILDTFPVLMRSEERAYGEFRTKRVILETYDALASAAAAGEPYVSPLPPPRRAS